MTQAIKADERHVRIRALSHILELQCIAIRQIQSADRSRALSANRPCR